MKILLGILFGLGLGLILFVNTAATFGGQADSQSRARIQSSLAFAENEFANLIPTRIQTGPSRSLSTLKSFIFPPEGKNPAVPLPTEKLTAKALSHGEIVWLGHSTLLMNVEGLIILTDPVFNRASPVPFFGLPFNFSNPIDITDLPPVDVILISHDHYDHLDHRAIEYLSKHSQQFLVPLGVKAHLLRWGVPEPRVTEFDWYEGSTVASVDFTLMPARHFSGRGLTDRNATLWGSWVVAGESLNLYFSGDGGYSPTFKEIGQSHGPFDIAFMENGAYNENWSEIHMAPEESVQAAIDLRAQLLMPIHWSKFDLSVHVWDEPAKRIYKEAKKRRVPLATPLIGEIFSTRDVPESQWWERVSTEPSR